MRAMPFSVWMALVFAPVPSLSPHWLELDGMRVGIVRRRLFVEGEPVPGEEAPRACDEGA